MTNLNALSNKLINQLLTLWYTIFSSLPSSLLNLGTPLNFFFQSPFSPFNSWHNITMIRNAYHIITDNGPTKIVIVENKRLI